MKGVTGDKWTIVVSLPPNNGVKPLNDVSTIMPIQSSPFLSKSFFDFIHRFFAWFDNEDIEVVTTTGDYTLEPYQTNTANPKVLKIPRDLNSQGNPTTWHYLEWRQSFGFDSGLSAVWGGIRLAVAIKFYR